MQSGMSPTLVLRLGCRVVRTIRKVEDGGDAKWNVQWVQEGSKETQSEYELPDDGVPSEDFDLIVIASGYFAQQYIPDIPGLKQFQGQIIHSSSLRYEREQLLFDETNDATGHIVVIGGSMSGVEAASAVALHQSSSTLSTNRIPHTQEVHHIFKTILDFTDLSPPRISRRESIAFTAGFGHVRPRPPTPRSIDYALGPIPEEKAFKTSSYFHSVLEIQYEAPDGNTKTIDNVAAIIMATGFTPYKSLSLLPDEVLTTLEYSKTDPFPPLILDKGGTIRSEIPDVGFVGFYRDPYWGVMEMQARFLGKLWSGENNGAPCETNDQKQSLRSLRLTHPNLSRGQFPMGDYVGSVESFAKDLEISRSALASGTGQSGPAVPARYLYGDTPTPDKQSEVERTLGALRDALVPGHETAQKAAASATFWGSAWDLVILPTDSRCY
ncbi:hypothetical protein DTO027I6_9874 [Penicillium roqueforti]|nr:hypothetical protein CBS147337_10077 [Penicillium roqueforti]KAI3185019.1 hypothetical protein DTO027I6_9874 [Penicillium roqueforti]